MDGSELGGVNRSALVDRFTNDIDNSSESFWANRHKNGEASVSNALTAHKTLGRVERNGAHVVATEVLSDL